MKNKLLLIAFILICNFHSVVQAQLIRTWTGLGDGHSWDDGYNWSSVMCKYMNEEGGFYYQTGYISPRTGEIIVFDNVGILNLTVPVGPWLITLGNEDFTDYSEVVYGCTYGQQPSFYSLQIFGNSNINLPTQIYAGGISTPIAGYSEALKIQNSTLTCSVLSGNYSGGSTLPLNMNSIYADNSVINCTSFFGPSGKTFFTNSTINTPYFYPNSNNDYPNEADEFSGCIINSSNIDFQGKCIAIITDCTFNLTGVEPAFAMNGYSTQNSVTLNNVQINVDAAATGSLWVPYAPGASVINGNINCNSTDQNFQIRFYNASNVNSYPLKLNGNLKLNNGHIIIYNQSGLEITGNFEMTGTPDPNYTRDVLINNQIVFQIGGIFNYSGYNYGADGPIPAGYRFGLKFSGAGDSHVIWPTGFPADTLIIEKTGCGKVYIDNGPLHVTGKLWVKSGQLVLSPHAASNYSLVDGADMIIEDGGSIVVQGNTDIAIAGNFIDHNATNNPATCNGFNNAAPNTVAFYNTQYTPVNRVIGSAGNTSVGNVAFINQDNNPFTLQNNLAVSNFDLGTNGKLVVGNYDLTVNGVLNNFDSSRYFITNGTGSLHLKNVGGSPVFFPVGANDTSYTPVTIANNGTPDDFKVRVQENLLSNGNSGTIITEKAINRTWNIEEAIPGGSDADITLQWNGEDTLNSFDKDNAYLIHYTNNNWDFGLVLLASGSDPYQLTRNNITSFSPFAIGNIDAIPGISNTLSLTVLLEGSFNGTNMNTTLNSENLIPLTQPYNVAPWSYSGTESVAVIPNANVVDWVLIELRDATAAATATAATRIARQAAFILNDGSVVGTDGSSDLLFNATITNNLFAIVWHKNHLGVISSVPLTLVGGMYSYSFTTGSAQAYGGVNGHKQLVAGKWGMFSGDGDANNTVNLADKTAVWTPNVGKIGYLNADFNRNGQVNNPDKNNYWLPNIGKVCQVP